MFLVVRGVVVVRFVLVIVDSVVLPGVNFFKVSVKDLVVRSDSAAFRCMCRPGRALAGLLPVALDLDDARFFFVTPDCEAESSCDSDVRVFFFAVPLNCLFGARCSADPPSGSADFDAEASRVLLMVESGGAPGTVKTPPQPLQRNLLPAPFSLTSYVCEHFPHVMEMDMAESSWCNVVSRLPHVCRLRHAEAGSVSRRIVSTNRCRFQFRSDSARQ